MRGSGLEWFSMTAVDSGLRSAAGLSEPGEDDM